MKLTSLYERVTATIVAELEAGAVTWVKPWQHQATGSVMPRNAATQRPYSGINIPILWGAAIDGEYQRHLWLTYRQTKALGGFVRKGEHGTIVVFTRKLRVGEDDEAKLISMLRTYTVFNVAQIDGVSWADDAPMLREPERLGRVEAFVAATNADIRIGGQAMYVPAFDFIAMPPAGTFTSIESFYATELHELGHWSGPRLDRDLRGRFGTQAYAAEELIAELTAAFLCAHLGITGELRHAGYIQSWLKLLKGDPRAIFTAAAKASQAADFLRGFSEAEEDTDDQAA